MESAIVIALAIVAFLLIGPWVVAFRALHKNRKTNELSDQRWDSIRSRLENVERGLSEFKATLAKLENVPPIPEQKVAPVPMREAEVRAPEPPPFVRHDFRTGETTPPAEPAKPPVEVKPPALETLPGVGMTPPAKRPAEVP